MFYTRIRQRLLNQKQKTSTLKQCKAKVFKAKTKNFYTKGKQFLFFVVFLRCIFALKKRKSGSETSITILLKYQNNAKLCYTNTDSFIINIKTEDFYEDIANDAEKRLIHQIMKSIDHYVKE